MDLTSFIKVGNNRKEAYEDYIDFEKGFKENSVVISFEEFCKELDKGYGKSDYTQIARLYEDNNGCVWYDNEYIS